MIMYSKEYIKYIKKIKKSNIIASFTQIIIAICFIFIWQILANKEVINTFITSSPKEIVKMIIHLHKTHNLYQHIWTTIYETLISKYRPIYEKYDEYEKKILKVFDTKRLYKDQETAPKDERNWFAKTFGVL